MPPKKHETVWEAKPHTIAKIQILEGYLQAWFPILGRVANGQDLLYVDGFAGPGHYTNHEIGSPLAAAIAASSALSGAGGNWRAGHIICAFIEPDMGRHDNLKSSLEPFSNTDRLNLRFLRSNFVDGMSKLKQEMTGFFQYQWPLLVFIDPFGATGAPFSTVRDILSSPRSEVLINFDADAVGRILRAGVGAGHQKVLREIFGDDSWRELDTQAASFENQCRSAVQLYKRCLRSIPRVEYVFSFEMMNETGTIGYDLIFASQHPRGLEKMKEAMKRIDQRGDYTFSDARVGQPTLFRFDDPVEFAQLMHHHFSGTTVPYIDVIHYALNETPFTNAKAMLKILEEQGRIDVTSSNPKRKQGQFPESSVRLIGFRSVEVNG